MNTDQIADFKTRLEEEKGVLETELSKVGARNTANPSDWVPAKPADHDFGADKSDNADVFEALDENASQLNELEGRLNQVIRALEKVSGGTYGTCEVSGEEIEVERLNANPAARTCIAHMAEEAKLP